MTLSAQGKQQVPREVGGDASREQEDRTRMDQENANAQSALDEENRRVQAALDEMNRIAFGYKEPPPTDKEKVSAVASFAVATVAAVLVPAVPWVITWVLVFAGMSILFKCMRE